MGSEWANWVVLFSQTLTRNYSLNVSKHLIPLTQFMYYLESTTHFNLLSPRTCDFQNANDPCSIISPTIMSLREREREYHHYVVNFLII